VGYCYYFDHSTSEPENKIERKPGKDYMSCVSVCSWPSFRGANCQANHTVQLLYKCANSNSAALGGPFQSLKNLRFGFRM